MKAPFTYFGGKSSIAEFVWSRLGLDAQTYIEPFAGSLAVLLAHPYPDHLLWESVCDTNGWLVNFWRSVKYHPEETAKAAEYPISHADLIARGNAMFYPGHDDARKVMYERHGGLKHFLQKLINRYDFCDPEIAGMWVWGVSASMGDNFSKGARSAARSAAGVKCGITNSIPHFHNRCGVFGLRNAENLPAVFTLLANRLERVRIFYGDWTKVLRPKLLMQKLPSAVFLDPPYPMANREPVYGDFDDEALWKHVHDWCVCMTKEQSPVRIALCGYTEHDELAQYGWTLHEWSRTGGHGNRSGNQARHQERMWFSPTCVMQRDLFSE